MNLARRFSLLNPSGHRWLAAVAVAALALALRGWYAGVVPESTDEINYLAQAARMKTAVASGDYQIFTGPIHSNDHPHLVKMLFAARTLGMSEGEELQAARGVSIGFGALAVFVLALHNPLAGLLLAVQSSAIKYTAVAQIEAVPQAMFVVSVLALHRSRPDRFDLNAVLSAAALAAMAAAKFTYLPLALVIGWMLHLGKPRRAWRVAGPYYVIAAATFLALMPTLWVSPIDYLRGMAEFHRGVAEFEAVHGPKFTWYQSFIWMSQPITDYPGLFPFNFDFPILAAGLLGLRHPVGDRSWVRVWLAVGFATLLLWPNKWPQYPMLVYPALALSAAGLLQRWPARAAAIAAILTVALTLRWSAVLDLPVDRASHEARIVQTALGVVEAARAGELSEFPARTRDSAATGLSVGIYGSLFAIRDSLRLAQADLENYIYLGRYLNGVFGAGAVALVAAFSLPAALILSFQPAVIAESARADLGSLAQFFTMLGIWCVRRPGRYQWLGPLCVALGVAALPGGLLVIAPLLALFGKQLGWDRRKYGLLAAASALLLTDVWIHFPSKAALWLGQNDPAASWRRFALSTQTTPLLQELGDLPVYVDALILLAGLAGLALVGRRMALLMVVCSLLTFAVPLGYRPWFLLCGPLWAYSASRTLIFGAERLAQLQKRRRLSRQAP